MPENETTARDVMRLPPEPRLSAVVPTLGLSPWLASCLEALRRDGGSSLEILLVAPETADVAAAEPWVDRLLRTPEPLGFAAANNLAMAEAQGDYLATVNDDAIVDEGWCGRLLEALEQRPDVAAAQGVNVLLDDSATVERTTVDHTTVDGAGLAWNRFWQAVQIGHGKNLSTLPTGDAEVFGVSATAAIYRRSAIASLAQGARSAFDERLFTYYEDVDLACRLRGRGFQALCIPGATARHAGSISATGLPGGKARWLYRNRQLVLARLLGRAFWPRWPLILLRDAADLWRMLRRGETATASAILAGLGGMMTHGASFARLGRPLVPLRELRRFRIDSDAG